MTEWKKGESSGFRELASTPLLLTLICLAFDDSLSFPKRRVELYQDATEALLKKWDSSRGVFRSKVYQNLSVDRKRQLLSRLAATNFEDGQYYLAKDKLLLEISSYIAGLPRNDDGSSRPDPAEILTAIEAQHGLLVERALKLYSFSHLTLQEYFTARYIIDNQLTGTLDNLIANASEHSRWREVFLMTASMLDDATSFLKDFALYASKKLQENPRLNAFIEYLVDHRSAVSVQLLLDDSKRDLTSTSREKSVANQDKLLEAIFTLAGCLNVGHYGESSEALGRAREAGQIVRALSARKLHAPIEKLAMRIMTDSAECDTLINYLGCCSLMVEALRSSMALNRKDVEGLVLRPIWRSNPLDLP